MAGKLMNSLTLILLVVTCSAIKRDGLILTQVVVLSRHNIRTPLTDDCKIARITPNKWPDWPTKTGFLTAKGALLEGHMGEYFSAWLKKENLLPSGCPEGTVNIYANSNQRTKQSAIAFTNAAFRYCNVTVNFKNITGMDPIFKCVIHNTSEAFKNIVVDEMKMKIKNNNLKNAYIEMEKILDYNNSIACLEDHLCSLVNDENSIVYMVSDRPEVDGPLWTANIAADAFLMSYYEGLPLEDIGWGKMNTLEHWALIAKFISASQDVKFSMLSTAKEFAGPLVKYIAKTFLGQNKTLFTLLMGHDANINTVMTALSFKPFELPGQLEKYPIGGKLVFQKYLDQYGVYYLKVEYVYLTSDDTRKGSKISLDSPPQRVTLALDRCITDERGLCPWNTFVKILEDFL